MLRVQFSPVNNAYIILFGDSIIDIDGKRFFESKEEIKDYIKYKGLKLTRNEITLAD